MELGLTKETRNMRPNTAGDMMNVDVKRMVSRGWAKIGA